MTDSEVRKVLKESSRLGRAQGRLGGEQGRRPARRGRSQGAGQAAERGGARSWGSPTTTPCSSHLNEQSQEQVLKLFDDLDALTREPFRSSSSRSTPSSPTRAAWCWRTSAPGTITTRSSRSRRPSSPPTSTRSTPRLDILKLCRDFYAGIGLPIDDVIARSDLYEKPGKSPHAFCTDIDREGDVRVLANIVPNEYWMGTMLHELGHSVYSSKNIPRDVPYVLRSEAHILTTEGVAMLFERFSKDADWLLAMGVPCPIPRRSTGPAPDAARQAPGLLAMVPGHVPVREGPLR